MQPAFTILLNAEQCQHLGELTIILGQVDELMVRTITDMLDVPRETANVIMGSSKVADNSTIWSKLIRDRYTDPDLLRYVDFALKEIQEVSAGRNDFIHAYFALASLSGSGPLIEMPGGLHEYAPHPDNASKPIAVRIKTGKRTAIAGIKPLRDRAAHLSCLVAHIWDQTSRPAYAKSRPSWLGRLDPLPEPPPPKRGARKARGQQPPP